jgi:hypothetical protein
MCAELIDGSWFCAECASEERGIAARRRYRLFTADIAHETDNRDKVHEVEIIGT